MPTQACSNKSIKAPVLYITNSNVITDTIVKLFVTVVRNMDVISVDTRHMFKKKYIKAVADYEVPFFQDFSIPYC